MKSPFQFLRKSEFDMLLKHAACRRYAPGEVLLAQGSADRRIFIIQEGTVRVEQGLGAQSVELARIGPGEVFGEMSFVDGERPSASIIACDEVVALAVTHHNVLAVVRENPAFLGRFYKSLADMLARRLRQTSDRCAMTPAWDTAVSGTAAETVAVLSRREGLH